MKRLPLVCLLLALACALLALAAPAGASPLDPEEIAMGITRSEGSAPMLTREQAAALGVVRERVEATIAPESVAAVCTSSDKICIGSRCISSAELEAMLGNLASPGLVTKSEPAGPGGPQYPPPPPDIGDGSGGLGGANYVDCVDYMQPSSIWPDRMLCKRCCARFLIVGPGEVYYLGSDCGPWRYC